MLPYNGHDGKIKYMYGIKRKNNCKAMETKKRESIEINIIYQKMGSSTLVFLLPLIPLAEIDDMAR